MKAIEGESGRIMQPRGRAFLQLVGLILLEYDMDGCLVDVGKWGGQSSHLFSVQQQKPPGMGKRR